MLIQSRYTEIVVIFFASTIWHLSDQVARVKCLTQAPKTTWDNMNNQEIVVLYLILTPRCLLTAYKSKSHHQKSELTRVHLNIYVNKIYHIQ